MWRALMVQPACSTRGSRSCIACEVSRSMVSPSPRPTSAWGATVQARSADGRIARPTSPPAIRKQPTATSTSAGGRRRRASGRAASAATGTTDTVSAAVAGEWLPALDQEQDQQEQRRRERGRQQGEGQVGTQRRTMPVRTCGQARARRRTASAAGTASTAIGTCTTKIACHENACVSSPPATGPVAVPTTPAVTQAAIAAALAVHRDQELEAADQRQRAAERLHAPSRDQHLDRLRHRAPRRGAGEHRDADGAEDPRLAPARSTTAVGTATSPSTRLNEISTQATCATDVSRCRRMSGSASVTTAESASTSATVTASRGPTARRTRPSSQEGG